MNIQRRSWLLFRDLKVPRFNKCQFYNKFMSKIFIFMHIWNESKSQISLGHFIIDMIYLSLITLSTRYSTRFNEWFQRVHILVGMEKKICKIWEVKEHYHSNKKGPKIYLSTINITKLYNLMTFCFTLDSHSL